jgi:reactive intermediate/imine deaminase
LPFSSAVRIGDILYLSGQMGFGEDGVLPEGMAEQARQTMENIRAVLASAGLGFGDVFHCTVMLADMSQWAAFNEVYLPYFSDPLPTRSAFGASGLAMGGLVELECQAYAGK